ncbi:unnamed protein product [Parnassius apollo]|uniref:(apollo) hypothetical protein n=1 Tax=Parnassius apollo TaxID=110799 RepID=A0A8S3WLI1_PARAO|nr:unnamed protein product [Parnassius apollo]
MESHILNMYHQPRFRSIGHKILRSTSESLSSEGSCQQNSPEYVPDQQTNQYEEESNDDEYWEEQEDQNQVWNHNKNPVVEQLNQDLSSDEEEVDFQAQEIDLNRKSFDVKDIEQSEIDNVEEDSLVEGDDYDVIQVYAVHPDFDLEASSEDEEQSDWHVKENGERTETEEYYNTDEDTNCSVQENYVYDESETTEISHDALGINLDTPVVSNVDEYFIKDNRENHILEVKDKPVVNDVDEYFIKDTKQENNIPNVDDFFIKNEVPKPTVTAFHIKDTPIVNLYGVQNSVAEEVHPHPTEEQEPHAEVSINDSDLDVLPNIEEIKKFLLDDIPYMKLKNAQKSCSVPHSPMHSICMDLDAKTCLSFEDLNLDLSDLDFGNEKDKSANSSKSEDIPRTLTEEDVNSFLITSKTQPAIITTTEDDLNPQDMDIDGSVESATDNINPSSVTTYRNCSSTPIPKSTVLEFCIEKSAVKKENDVKVEPDDFVDVESCNESVIPVLEANNLNSLLEQFEATEKFNPKPKKSVIKVNDQKVKTLNSLTNGMRLQDAGVQLNKNKMRQIMMPSSINTAIRRSPSPVHSDHDYCSSKKRHSLPNLKGGQSLLKPEVLSSNSRILNSRHRSCKNKKIVYHLSSDDENEKSTSTKIKKNSNNRNGEDNDTKTKKSLVKQPVKATVPSTCRKKTYPVHSANDICLDKGNSSVMFKNACKASDTPISQSSNGSIKLTIKNKSEVIIENCDEDYKNIEKNKSSSVSEKSANHFKANNVKSIEPLDSNQNQNKIENTNEIHNPSMSVKEEPISNPEHFYTALFSNKHDVQIPHSIDVKLEKRSHEEDIKVINDTFKNEIEQPQKKKKLNLQEYKLRRGVNSNQSSATVSPEAIFPDLSIPENIDKIPKSSVNQTPANGVSNYSAKTNSEVPKKIFDPIREASRKILMNTKKQKAEAMRKRDEDIVMSKIPKVENLELQPLISEAEMMKIVGMGSATDILPIPVVNEKPPQLSDYDEIVVVSVGTNTDDEVFKKLQQAAEHEKRKSQTPPTDTKSTINFKIKKSDHILKHNVFDTLQKDRSPKEDKKHSDIKIDKERFKDITATLKSVEKQVETKISSNSLFASIQDVVMKKAPEVIVPNKGQSSSNGEQKSKPNSPMEKKSNLKYYKTTIVRDYDAQAEHGEDKIILHLEKQRKKPDVLSILIQTELKAVDSPLALEKVATPKEEPSIHRKRNDSDMSMSSESSPDRIKKDIKPAKVEEKPSAVKPKLDKRESGGTQTKEKRSRSKERYDSKYRRSRSPARVHRRKRSHSRNRSRSRSRYRRYRRSNSPHRRKRRSHTRSPYRKRRSPSPRREFRNRSRSRSKHAEPIRPKSPVVKKSKPSPAYESSAADKKPVASLTPPPIRKPTVSESSDSSTSSSSSSSSSSSEESVKSRRSSSSYRKGDNYKKKNYRSSYSSEDRESNTPVEERRIVFVGKLEKDITKSTLRGLFSKFGPVTEVRLHTKEDGSRYGFVTYRKSRDAWAAVEAASSFPQYDVGFGGRRAFCRQSYADLDGLEAKYTESAFHGQAALPTRRNDDMSFEQMLLDVKKKLNQRKGDKKRHDDTVA